MVAPGKRKLSRKAQIRELAAAKKASAADPAYVPSDSADEQDDAEGEGAGCAAEVDVAGGAAVREAARRKKGRQRELLRGVGEEARSMQVWLSTVMPAASETAAAEAAAVVAAEMAAQAAAQAAAEEDAKTERAAAAADERARYARIKRERSPAAAPLARPRLCRTFSAPEGGAKPRERKRRRGTRTKKAAGKLTPEMIATLEYISSAKRRCFKKSDIVDGEKLSRIEWAVAKGDYLELRKVYALNRFVCLRREGSTARAAFDEVSKTVVKPNGKNVN